MYVVYGMLFTVNAFILKYQYTYNIGVLTVHIEFMWQGLETGKRRDVEVPIQ